MSQTQHPLRLAFGNHPSRWADFFYAYPVISRRSGGLSIGVNLNPDRRCTHSCVYCQVDHSHPPRISRVDIEVLERELRSLLTDPGAIFADARFASVPETHRALRDLAFSGDGEPTYSPAFPYAARCVARLRSELGLRDVSLIVLTNACHLHEQPVAEALDHLYANNGELWAKLDAGTESYFRQINRSAYSLAHVVGNIREAGKRHPLVIQTMLLAYDGEPPTDDEIAAYCDRLRGLRDAGTQIRLVQLYTVARKTAADNVAALEQAELKAIAERVGETGHAVQTFA